MESMQELRPNNEENRRITEESKLKQKTFCHEAEPHLLMEETLRDHEEL